MRVFARLGALAAGMLMSASSAFAAAPELVSPAGASAALCPTFSWSSVAGAAGYELVVYRVAEQASPEAEPALRVRLPGGATSWTPPGSACLVAGDRYAWTLRISGDSTGEEEWSEPKLFEVPVGPSFDEVQAAIETLQRYMSGSRATASGRNRSPGSQSGEEKESAEERFRPHRTVGGDDGSPGPFGNGAFVSPRDARGRGPVPAAATSPSLGTPSLTVDANIALGSNSNIFKGGTTLLWDDDFGNTALGQSALRSATGYATNNTAIGRRALEFAGGAALFEGSWNTAVGDAALRFDTTGFKNTGVGYRALSSNTTGQSNSAIGNNALFSNTTGSYNTASGWLALYNNVDGSQNTATGVSSLYSNTTGTNNTAHGTLALADNTDGYENTATGWSSLQSNTSGFSNTATGSGALVDNTTGNTNTATGWNAMSANTEGFQNTAIGGLSLYSNTVGDGSAALGHYSLHDSTTGDHNTALGDRALRHNTTGSENVAVGFKAGDDAPVDASSNVFLASLGDASDSTPTIRIGDSATHTRAFLAGVSGVTVSGSTVLVSSSGQLGVASSSRRFKEEIRDLGDVRDRLAELRPVTFRYRPEVLPEGGPQVGLIAEEVAEVFPELVATDAEGRPTSVRYDLLSVLLLDELQRAEAENERESRDLRQELAMVRRRLLEVERRGRASRPVPWWRRLFRRSGPP